MNVRPMDYGKRCAKPRAWESVPWQDWDPRRDAERGPSRDEDWNASFLRRLHRTEWCGGRGLSPAEDVRS